MHTGRTANAKTDTGTDTDPVVWCSEAHRWVPVPKQVNKAGHGGKPQTSHAHAVMLYTQTLQHPSQNTRRCWSAKAVEQQAVALWHLLHLLVAQPGCWNQSLSCEVCQVPSVPCWQWFARATVNHQLLEPQSAISVLRMSTCCMPCNNWVPKLSLRYRPFKGSHHRPRGRLAPDQSCNWTHVELRRLASCKFNNDIIT